MSGAPSRLEMATEILFSAFFTLFIRRLDHLHFTRTGRAPAVIAISSYLPEVMLLSDRLLVSRQGRIVEEFNSLEATEEKIMYASIH